LLRLVSHELRTPLNSIIGFSEIIARELHGSLGDPRYQDYAEMVNASGLKLLKLVNDVIELIRLEAGVADLDIRSEDPSSAVEDAAETVGVEARARRVRFDIQSGPVPRIEADHRGLRIALVQLFQNAIACSPDGGTVRVRYRTAGEMTAIEIEDDGPSVPEQDVPRLSRPAAHDADALTRNSEGAMLGLPIARLLAEKMGGRLRLSSEPGAGLCAAIQLRTVENDRPDA
jgi:signal transduction histidine kinase